MAESRYLYDTDTTRWRRRGEPVVVYRPSFDCPFTRHCDFEGVSSRSLQAHLRRSHGATASPRGKGK